MDQIGNFLAGLGRGGGALLPAIGGGMQTVRAAEQSATANNKTFQALIGAGVDRTVAEAAISNPQLMDALLKQKFGGGKYGKTGAIFQDQDGTFKSAQFAEDGNIKITPLPGLEPARGVVTVDDGTGTQIRSKASGREVTRVPKDIAGREAQEEIGKATGKAAANLPLVMAAADRITSGIDKVLNDPYLPSMTGPVAGRLPNLSADANRVQSYVDQIQGGTFLQAYNDLRGGGAITEKEGEKATAAYNRLANMKVEDKDYRAALNEFRSEILKLRDLAIKKAQGGAVAAPGGWSVQEVK